MTNILAMIIFSENRLLYNFIETFVMRLMKALKFTMMVASLLVLCNDADAQKDVKFARKDTEKKVDVMINGKLFTSFIYTDDIDKPVLYPLATASGNIVTRGFP
jgi:hypothetical protein